MPDDDAKTRIEERHARLRAMSLLELGRHFGTDKATTHRYLGHYERHFAHFKNHVMNLLEIGIGGSTRAGQGGSSLRMWKWFFPKAAIVGLDIVNKEFVRRTRIDTYQGSQDDEALLRRIHEEKGPFRIIIDDGSHRSEHVRESFRVLFPLLEEGGLYVIEDTQTSYWPEYGGSEDRSSPNTMMGMVKDLVDGLNYVEFIDDDYLPSYSDLNVSAVHCYHNLVFIEKGPNSEPTHKHRILRKRYARTEE